MKIITISREFASGGRELGKRMADILGFDYYDREIISAIADNKGLNETYVENMLENHGWRSFPLTFHSSITGIATASSISADLFAEQKKVIEKIAEGGRDFIIIGRSADVILQDKKPLNIFVCADMDAKVARCIRKADKNENLSEKALRKEILRIDKNRSCSRELISDTKWGDRKGYDLIVNTTQWEIKELAEATARFAESWFARSVD